MKSLANILLSIDIMSCYESNNLIEDKFWLDDPKVLFRKNNFYKFYPTDKMNRIEIYNTLTRFFIYLTLIYLLISTDTSYVLIPILAILVIIILFYINKNSIEFFTCKTSSNSNIDTIHQVDQCQEPNANNPFMNVTMDDLMSNHARLPACNVMDDNVKSKINDNLFYDEDDVFNRNSTNRQFYTTPITTIPNDQMTFAKWLNDIPVTCKEDQRYCLRYEDIRFNRYNPYIDKTIPNNQPIL